MSSSTTTVTTVQTLTSQATTTSVVNTVTTTMNSNVVGLILNWTYTDTDGITNAQMSVSNLKLSQWLAVGLSVDQYMVGIMNL